MRISDWSSDVCSSDLLADGEIRVRNQFLSVEPAMRGWIADRGNYAAPVAIGSVMRALGAGVVIESRDNDFTVGDAVAGWFGWQEEAVVRADAMVRRIAETDLPLSLKIGRAHVCTPVTNAHLVCRLLLET